MKNFVQLFHRLDQTTKTLVKVDALTTFFREADERDRLWAMALLSHRRPRRAIKGSLLRQWVSEESGIPLWLVEESYPIVGDLAETIALMLPDRKEAQVELPLSHWIEYIRGMAKEADEVKREKVVQAWKELDRTERFLFNKLITGGFRVGVSQKLMMRAVAAVTEKDENAIAHRLMGNWTPDTTTWDELLLSDNPLDDISRPYPFYLAYALEDVPESLGSEKEWQAERKWDGIRGQLIVRNKELFVWSRGEELITEKFPEYHNLAAQIPDGTVIDGEILPFDGTLPLSFNVLQTRIGRKNVTKKILESAPVILMAYDLLEYDGEDIREKPLKERRALLEKIVANCDSDGILMLSEIVPFKKWEELVTERAQSRSYNSEGLMLKRLDSIYRSGRKRGDWYKWKVEPLTIDAVMIYAQQGSGRRANLYSDFTFAVWKDEETLVPFTKAYSGLTDAEFRKITAWVRRNTLEKFGPVRSVKPELVFEIAFEGINASKRHKSGVALRFPRILRWRHDKPTKEANTLQDLQAMLKLYG